MIGEEQKFWTRGREGMIGRLCTRRGNPNVVLEIQAISQTFHILAEDIQTRELHAFAYPDAMLLPREATVASELLEIRNRASMKMADPEGLSPVPKVDPDGLAASLGVGVTEVPTVTSVTNPEAQKPEGKSSKK